MTATNPPWPAGTRVLVEAKMRDDDLYVGAKGSRAGWYFKPSAVTIHGTVAERDNLVAENARLRQERDEARSLAENMRIQRDDERVWLADWKRMYNEACRELHALRAALAATMPAKPAVDDVDGPGRAAAGETPHPTDGAAWRTAGGEPSWQLERGARLAKALGLEKEFHYEAMAEMVEDLRGERERRIDRR